MTRADVGEDLAEAQDPVRAAARRVSVLGTVARTQAAGDGSKSSAIAVMVAASAASTRRYR